MSSVVELEVPLGDFVQLASDGHVVHGMHAVFIPLYKSPYIDETNIVWINTTAVAVVDARAGTMIGIEGTKWCFEVGTNPFDKHTIDPLGG